MVESALRDVQLWDEVKDRLQQNATHLTLEQQQKLCIARLLPLEAPGDPHGRALLGAGRRGDRAIETLIGELRAKYTILIVTHNMAQARRASDECIFMLMGRTIEHDKTLAIFHTPPRKRNGNVHYRPVRIAPRYASHPNSAREPRQADR